MPEYIPCTSCGTSCDPETEAYYPYGEVDEDNEYIDPEQADDAYCANCVSLITPLDTI